MCVASLPFNMVSNLKGCPTLISTRSFGNEPKTKSMQTLFVWSKVDNNVLIGLGKVGYKLEKAQNWYQSQIAIFLSRLDKTHAV